MVLQKQNPQKMYTDSILHPDSQTTAYDAEFKNKYIMALTYAK